MKKNGTPRSAARITRPHRDRFYYGWRYVERRGPNGEKGVEQVPLTLEDVLHPQEDDVIPESSLHNDERTYLKYILEPRLARLKRARVFSDCLINWGVPGLRNHSLDISAFDRIAEPHRQWNTFPAGQQGARCLFVVELVSPKTRRNDLKRKPPEYHQAGVPLYIIVDQKEEDGPRRLLAYRNTPAGFVPEPLDERGRVLLKPLGVLLGLRDNRVVCYDAKTGEEIRDYTGETQARQAAEARLRELEAEMRRLRGAKKPARKKRRSS